MKLKDYLIKEKLNFRKFGKLVGIDTSYVSHMISGNKNPSLIIAKIIEEKTNGAVSMQELVNMDAPCRYKGNKNEKGKRRG